jgi:glycosyltransferase involved in cell wall biosynthesis
MGDTAWLIGTSWQSGGYWTVPGKLEVLAPYTQDTIDDLFPGIDVLLSPSQVKEPFGLTVREALVRNVWVVATNAGGTLNDLRHGERAAIIPLDSDYNKLKLAIEECMGKEDWDSYVNPYRSEITSYSEQAAELSGLFESIAN